MSANKQRLKGFRHILIGSALMTPAFAYATQASDWADNIGDEVGAVIGVVVAVGAAIGVVMGMIGIMGIISAKKTGQPLGHNPWLIAGGVLLTVLVPLITVLGASVTDDDQTETQLQESIEWDD